MKTLSGILPAAGTLVIAIAGAIAIRTLAQTPAVAPASAEPADPAAAQQNFVLKIKPRHPLKDGSKDGEKAFKDLLNNGHYPAAKGNKVHMRHTDANETDEYLPTGSDISSTLKIKTDKVIVSETAKGAKAEDLTLIGPHVTIQIACVSTDDVKKVLDLLAP